MVFLLERASLRVACGSPRFPVDILSALRPSYAAGSLAGIARRDESRVALERVVAPEWLDVLPPEDPRAVRSRRDLRVVNSIMGHAGIIAAALRRHLDSDRPSIAELGAGDGTLLARVLAGRMARKVVLVDRQPAIDERTRARYLDRGIGVEIQAADVFEWLRQERRMFDVVVTNLFLHHFEDAALGRLLEGVSRRTKLFIACEPRRARLPLVGSRLLGLIGCNDVTRHDAYVSVLAGFRGRELSVLWPDEQGWALTEGNVGLFSHSFVAHSADGAASRS
jgi:hypothetical protein